MNRFNCALAAIVAGVCFMATAPKVNAQVNIDVGAEPACPYGYYDFAPYPCAPYGYYGPEWFAGGVFVARIADALQPHIVDGIGEAAPHRASAIIRQWHASAISKPPPSAVPFMAATTGFPQSSIFRKVRWIFIIVSKTALAALPPPWPA